MNVLMAVLSAWRLTQLVTEDRISEPLRRRLGWQVLTCGRCVSVWAGGFATLAFFFLPYANWPLAFSEIYMIFASITDRLKPQGPKVVLHPGGGIELVGGVTRDQAELSIIALAERIKLTKPQES